MISPIENRYLTDEMKAIFSEESKLQTWLTVEVALAQTHAELGHFSEEIAEEITKKANLKNIPLSRVKEIDQEIHHDVMAMVKALSEACDPEAAKYVHLGATSNDIVDTAWGSMFAQAISVIEKRLITLVQVLLRLAEQHKDTICVGRTHGQHALPYSYGLRFSLWMEEIIRHIKRMHRCRDHTLVGKMSGAIGTMASLGTDAIRFQERFLARLGLNSPQLTNQVVQRDIHAEVIFLLANIASTLAKFSKQIRILQRTEISEIMEPLRNKQVGSSTMPMKRNPHKCERISGLYRLIRSNMACILDNNALMEDERDIANSSVERIVFPQTFVLVDYMLSQMLSILPNLEFNLENVERNLNLTDSLMAERIMLVLVDKGLGRQEAHEILRKAARASSQSALPFSEILLSNDAIINTLESAELSELLDPRGYLGQTSTLVDNSLKEARGFLERIS
ncbi:MAG: adenylosuccinate lyase [Candidatus Hodarchaeales archaeon]|jgi:adenylosuccinate lyase